MEFYKRLKQINDNNKDEFKKSRERDNNYDINDIDDDGDKMTNMRMEI